MLLTTRGKPPQKKDVAFLLADAAAPVVGGLIVLVSALSQQALAVFLGLTSGFFLFAATGDLLPEAHHRSPRFMVTLAMLVGIIFHLRCSEICRLLISTLVERITGQASSTLVSLAKGLRGTTSSASPWF